MSRSNPEKPRRLGFLTLVLCCWALVLFFLSLNLDLRNPRVVSFVIYSLALTIATVLLLQLFHWNRERTRRILLDKEAYAREREFASVFEHTLDGILILDDQAVCRAANPAAIRLLRLGSRSTTGWSFAEFQTDRAEFAAGWQAFLDCGYQRSQMQLVCADHSSLFVEFTATANYIPGRHVFILCDNTRRKNAETSLQNAEERFRQMADHIQEVFWMMDAGTKKLLYVNRAFETLTGRARSTLGDDPLSYREIIHPEDRLRIMARLGDGAVTGEFNEEFRITRSDGSTRWLWSRAFLVRSPGDESGCLIGTALDVTTRKHAELQIAAHLAAAEAARSEADALRKATLALTENLAMDCILDTLLACLSEVVPYSYASVLFAEADERLLVAREAPRRKRNAGPLVVASGDHPLLRKILVERRSLFIRDTESDGSWTRPHVPDDARCWMGIPLIASGEMLGILSVAARAANALTPEHLRLAKSLAIPAAVGIQNARIHERAAIYASELERQLKQLEQVREALGRSRTARSGA